VTIVIRVDASSQIGVGHLLRCLSLANKLFELGFAIVFVCNGLTEKTYTPIHKSKHRVLFFSLDNISKSNISENYDWQNDAKLTIELLISNNIKTDLVLVDHYQLEKKWENQLKHYCDIIVVIDDLFNREHQCNLIVNQGVSDNNYDNLVPANCLLLIGPNYALISDEYFVYREKSIRRKNEETNQKLTVVVFFGGGNNNKLFNWILPILAETVITNISFKIVSSLPLVLNSESLSCLEDDHRFELLCGLNGIYDLLANSDFAIAAGGVSTWERCSLGIPTLVIQTAENQQDNIQFLLKNNIGIKIDWQKSDNSAVQMLIEKFVSSSSMRKDMSDRAYMKCDGLGVSRVAIAIETLINPNSSTTDVSLISANEEHEDIILKWQNQPGARAHSRNTKMPTVMEHNIWFTAKLQNPRCIFKLILFDDKLVGFVRLDLMDNGNNYEISILISSELRAKGLGIATLKLIRKIIPRKISLYAYIKHENYASVSLFEKAGYVFNSEYYVN